jgi:phage baseplate assembly protein W
MADLNNLDTVWTDLQYDLQAPLEFATSNFDWQGVETVIYVTPTAPPTPAPAISSTLSASLASVVGDYGSDVLVFPGVDGNLNLVADWRVVAEALARRLSTPRGTLPFHPDYGLDVREYLNEAVTQDALYRMKAAVELECEQDERVENAEATITYSASTQTLRLSIEATTTTGPLRFVLNVSQVSVELLSQE